MKKALYLTGLAFFFTVALMAQANNAILFTENGEKFQVILNGILQNQKPETNVKMTELVADHYKCRIVFEDTKLGFVDFNMFFNEMGSEVTWNIKQNNKGQYVTRYVSAVPVAQAPQTPPTQTVVVYTTVAPPVSQTTTTTTHSQTTTTNGGGTDNVNINMGISGMEGGGNISINASGFGMDDGTMSSSSTTTTTTTHSSTTTTTGSGTVMTGSGMAITNTPPPTQVVYVQGYNGRIGCPVPMNPADFNDMKETIRSKDFENTKLTIAKQVLQNNCLTSQQVKEVVSLFDFENTKVDYAKYAYDHTYDVGNYYKINDAFEFESSVTDLNNYITGKR